MELSQTFKKQAKKLGVTEQYLIMADLMSIGYSEMDAYTIAYPENAALSAQQNKSIREKVSSSAKFQALLETKTGSTSDGEPTEQIDSLLDKNQTAKLIMKAAMEQPANSKERIEGLMKYSDLMGYKKEDTGDTKDSIIFAFPIKCNQCPLLSTYNEYRKNNGEQELRPVEMERIIRQAADIIDKARNKK